MHAQTSARCFSVFFTAEEEECRSPLQLSMPPSYEPVDQTILQTLAEHAGNFISYPIHKKEGQSTSQIFRVLVVSLVTGGDVSWAPA